MKRKVIKEGFIKGGGQMKGLGRLMALSSYLMAALEKKNLIVGDGNKGFAADGR